MATNKILPFADTAAAGDTLTDAQYASDSRRNSGHVRGIASKELANKSTKQAAAMAAGLGQFVADNQSADVTDADTPAGLATKITNALKSLFALKSHAHVIADVAQLQAALDAKYNKTGGLISGDVTVAGNTLVQGKVQATIIGATTDLFSAPLMAKSDAGPQTGVGFQNGQGGVGLFKLFGIGASLRFECKGGGDETNAYLPCLFATAGAAQNDVVGATTAWVTSKLASDRRLKSELEPVGSTLDRLAGIEAYTYKMDGYDGRKLGSIAQDWQAAFPEATVQVVWHDGKPTIGVEPLSAIAVLVNAVNELSARVKALESK